MTTTPPLLTRFEEAKIVGIRAEMIARGHQPLVALTDKMMRHGMYDPKIIAQEEFAQGLLPFELHRAHPDGSKQVVDAFRPHQRAVTQNALQ